MGKGGSDEVYDTLVRAMREPEPVNWRSQYTPERADQYTAELEQLERELDDGWPGWRRKEPWTQVTPDKAAWIKHRLKRRDLIVRGRGAWGVRIMWRGEGDRRVPMAVPVRPPRVHVDDRSAFEPVVSVAHLARQLGAPLQIVRESLALLPDGERAAAEWVGQALNRRRAASTDSTSSPETTSTPSTSSLGEVA